MFFWIYKIIILSVCFSHYLITKLVKTKVFEIWFTSLHKHCKLKLYCDYYGGWGMVLEGLSFNHSSLKPYLTVRQQFFGLCDGCSLVGMKNRVWCSSRLFPWNAVVHYLHQQFKSRWTPAALYRWYNPCRKRCKVQQTSNWLTFFW